MGDKYRLIAADLFVKAKDHESLRAHYESMALSYLRLADQADRRGDYEHPAQTHPAHPTQQQQQPQQQQQQQQQQPQKKSEPDGTR